ncbi:BZ3500_MvSof-1268-A1-R1_Chr7-1g09334 [Microbotryum saponariae]|uniref:BZ3500_MvSof-1268-A1-R1_Chr7-1g09334 protein n=1 Tax=Microbotryum saponariae TaxID=289078 RepID=A0A2X0LDV9_9BASI|nr:BZ3501_MvSof-1269-A2-R1_Chr7-1g09039 [Microbotryum saponariae]SDA03250.1 BZ3500_MvSof-1268-A1-R1_Chr7-1g09334 [Microbotryum saponariae]
MSSSTMTTTAERQRNRAGRRASRGVLKLTVALVATALLTAPLPYAEAFPTLRGVPARRGSILARPATRSVPGTPSRSLGPHFHQDEEDRDIQSRIDTMAAAAMASHIAKKKARATESAEKIRMRALDEVVELDATLSGNFSNDTIIDGSEMDATTKISRTPTCLGSWVTDVDINKLFYYGGANTTVTLCPRATINLTNTIFFTAAGQVLTTAADGVTGNPTDDARAKLVVTGAHQSCAIYGACDQCSNIVVSNIQVLGQRDVLGYLSNGLALLELGGMTNGQVSLLGGVTSSVSLDSNPSPFLQIVRNVKASEPRGWSVVHAIEGANLVCSNMLIENNQIGPSGNAPNTGLQFRRRAVNATIAPGQWADGISLACKGSTVRNNVVTDATDGGIVIFGAPGSLITGNTIQSVTRRALGGINAVDYAPFAGNYSGTVVENNHLITNGQMMKVGVAIGGMIWGSDNRTASRGHFGTFRYNTFTSLNDGYFGYSIAVAGHENATVIGNNVLLGRFGGGPSPACIPNPMIPTPQALVRDSWTTPGSSLQAGFNDTPLVFLICSQPGAIQPLSESVDNLGAAFVRLVENPETEAAEVDVLVEKRGGQIWRGTKGFAGVAQEGPAKTVEATKTRPTRRATLKRKREEVEKSQDDVPQAKVTPIVPRIGFENPFGLLERAKRDR